MEPEKAELCTYCVDFFPLGNYFARRVVAPRGVRAHHSSLAALAQSSKTCSICRLMLPSREESQRRFCDWGIDTIDSLTYKLSLFDFQGEGLALSWAKVKIRFGKSGAFSSPIWSDKHLSITTCTSDCRLPICFKSLPLSRFVAINARQPIWRVAMTSTSDKITTAKSWLHDCKLKHQDCKPLVTQLPKRLIEVGSLDRLHPPRLVICEDVPTKDIEYATLSYCWGSAKFCTTKENEEEYKNEIPYHLLPATLQDALTITHQLDIQFLWIDALCIVQDDPAEWAVEASRMQDIYSGSTITIAATDAADGSVGCFPVNSNIGPELLEHLAFLKVNTRDGSEVTVRVQPGDIREYVSDSVLNTRGWVLQEMVLSHRILHLMRTELYWECRRQSRPETGLSFSRSEQTARIPVLQNFVQIGATSRVWWKWVQNYSQRQFSFPKDKIPALAGLVRHYQTTTEDIPILGLWKRSICQDLLWESVPILPERVEMTPYHLTHIPSWTWLSCPYEVRSSEPWNNGDIEFHIKVIEWAVIWTSEPLTSTIKSTRLILEGPVREIVLRVAPNQSAGPYVTYLSNGDEKPDLERHSPILRYAGQFDDGPRSSPTQYTCLLVRSELSTHNLFDDIETFLILEPCLGTRTYRRVGLGNVYTAQGTSTFDLNVRRTLSLV